MVEFFSTYVIVSSYESLQILLFADKTYWPWDVHTMSCTVFQISCMQQYCGNGIMVDCTPKLHFGLYMSPAQSLKVLLVELKIVP